MKHSYKNRINNLLRFDKIRLCKLLEISQHCLFGFSFTLLFGNLINSIFYDDDIEELSTIYLILIIFIELILTVLIVYYIRKIIIIIPFLFSFITNKYVPSKKDEVSNGYVIGSTLILTITLENLNKKFEELDRRIKNFFNS